MDPELNKRAKKITQTDYYSNLKPDEKSRFIKDVENAKSFDDLPQKCKEIMKAGEREIQGY